MQKSIVKFIALLYRHCSLCFGHYNAHHQEPVKLPLQPLVSVWMWRWKCSRPRTFPPPHSYGNQRPQRQFDGLLMMGIVMPETCWAVSVRQSNKILRLIVAPSWVFYLTEIRYWRYPLVAFKYLWVSWELVEGRPYFCLGPNEITFTLCHIVARVAQSV